MIGLMNVPCDSPAEFYAAAPQRPQSGSSPATLTPNNNPGKCDRPAVHSSRVIEDHNRCLSANIQRYGNRSGKQPRASFMSIFSRGHGKEVGYLKDGRKVFNGQVLENVSAPKLWEQLIVRSFVHKIEDEIQSPADQFSAVQAEFPKFNLHSNELSKSTFSLVSHDRVTSRCDKCSRADGVSVISLTRRSASLAPSSDDFDHLEIENHDWTSVLRDRQSKSVCYDQCGHMRRFHNQKFAGQTKELPCVYVSKV
ncbi:hypothetical protein Ddc_04946 [Ditylenchus destructor]|nr:hypothetical protein Ddc_04946 [Ditylenchus destructor]